jgi:NAD(P)-dependent dehydrogenase (short-subunit alcohol dehydrogenase family)
VTRALVFGGTGALGSAIVEGLRDSGWTTAVASRSASDGASVNLSDDGWAATAAQDGPFDGIVWAQGVNASGSVLDATDDDYLRLFDANVVFIARTLRDIVAAGALASPARGVVVSSIWQITARSNKVAYVASKAALAGLVPAIALDMAPRRFAINGVLPGVIDTPMTRSQLSQTQLDRVEGETLGGALATPRDVASAVSWLVDPSAAGINGQWIAVDNGWSAVRSV